MDQATSAAQQYDVVLGIGGGVIVAVVLAYVTYLLKRKR